MIFRAVSITICLSGRFLQKASSERCHREQEQVAADDELAYFVGNELVLLRFRPASGQVLKGLDGIQGSTRASAIRRTIWPSSTL